MIRPKIMVDRLHPRIGHRREQRVTAVDPRRVDGTLHATGDAVCCILRDGERPRRVAAESRKVARDTKLAVPP